MLFTLGAKGENALLTIGVVWSLFFPFLLLRYNTSVLMTWRCTFVTWSNYYEDVQNINKVLEKQKSVYVYMHVHIGSWNPLDLEADTLPIVPHHHPPLPPPTHTQPFQNQTIIVKCLMRASQDNHRKPLTISSQHRSTNTCMQTHTQTPTRTCQLKPERINKGINSPHWRHTYNK